MQMNLGSGNGFKAFLAFLGLMAFFGLSLGDVVINEVELSPPDNGTVWVELYNTGDAPVDLTSWTVKIEDGPWVGPIALVGSIDSKGFLAVDGQQSWVTTGNGTVYLLTAPEMRWTKHPSRAMTRKATSPTAESLTARRPILRQTLPS